MLPSFFLLSQCRGPSWGWPLRGLGVSEHPAVLQLALPCAATGRPGGFSPGVLVTLVPLPHSTVKHPRHA